MVSELYELWSLTMKTLFWGQDIWEINENGYVEPAQHTTYNALTQAKNDVLKDQRKMDGKTMFYIHQAMHDGCFERSKKEGWKDMFYIHQAMHESIPPRITSLKQAKEAWYILQTSYQGMDKVKISKLQILRRDFETLSIKDTNSIDSFYTRVIGMINWIKYYGETIEDRKVVEKVLKSLPPKFDTLVVTLEKRKELSHFSLDELQASIINHEHRSNRSNMSLENAFFVQSSIICGRGRGRANSRGERKEFF
jgi:hypothetical protein